MDLVNKSYRIGQGESIKALHALHAHVHALTSLSLSLKIFTPFRPMLAMRCTSTDLSKALRKGSVIVEPKLDGERLLIHKQGDEVNMPISIASDLVS